MQLSRLRITLFGFILLVFSTHKIQGQKYICDWYDSNSELDLTEKKPGEEFDFNLSKKAFERRPDFIKACLRSSLQQVSVNTTLDRYRSVWSTIYNTYLVQDYRGKYGAYDDQLNLILPVEFDEVRQMANNGWLLKSNGKWGAFSPDLKKITGSRFDQIFVIDEFSFLAGQSERLYLCDVGQGILEKFDEACFRLVGKGNHKVLCIEDNRKKALFNLWGDNIYDLYGIRDVRILGDSLGIVLLKGVGLINSLITYEGEVLLPFGKHKITPVYWIKPTDDIYYNVNENGIYTLYRNKESIVEMDRAAIGLGGTRSGAAANIDTGYTHIIKISREGKLGFYNTEKDYLSNIIYENVEDIVKGGISVEMYGQYGLVDYKEKELIPIQFDEIKGNLNSVVVKKGGSYGLYDNKGKEIWPVEYEKIRSLIRVQNLGVFRGLFVQNGKTGIYDDSFNIITPPKYDEVWSFFKEIAAFRIGDKWGLINANGKEITPALYDKIMSIGTDNVSRVTLNGKFQKIHKNGNCIEGCL